MSQYFGLSLPHFRARAWREIVVAEQVQNAVRGEQVEFVRDAPAHGAGLYTRAVV